MAGKAGHMYPTYHRQGNSAIILYLVILALLRCPATAAGRSRRLLNNVFNILQVSDLENILRPNAVVACAVTAIF